MKNEEYDVVSTYEPTDSYIGKYVQDNLNFGKRLENQPKVYSVNYFLRDSEDNWLNHKNDKRIWLKWMELRVNGDVDAIKTPTGYIPYYKDLKRLFKEVYDKEYSEEDYVKQFTTRIPENLSKIDRLTKIYTERVLDTPDILFEVLEEQKPIKYKGKVLHSAPKPIAEIEIERVEPDLCYARIISKKRAINNDEKVREKVEEII